MEKVTPFVKLKAELASGMPPVVVLFGKDAFLKKNAVELLKKVSAIQMEELNFCKIEEFDAERVVREANTLPFVDTMRLVVAHGAEKATAKDLSTLGAYLSAPSPSTCLVLVFGDEPPKKLSAPMVDCNALDPDTMSNWIRVNAKKFQVQVEPEAVRLLIERTGAQMFRVKSELEKLGSLAGPGGTITSEMVEQNVAAENEYQVFVFTDLVSKRKKAEALAMMDKMLMFEKNIFGIWSALYNHFRRMFYAKITKKSTKEIADLLSVKEFAISKARTQAENFRAVELKQILETIAATEENIKTGKMSQELAIKTGLVNILSTRG